MPCGLIRCPVARLACPLACGAPSATRKEGVQIQPQPWNPLRHPARRHDSPARACVAASDAAPRPFHAPRRGMEGWADTLPRVAVTLGCPDLGRERVARYPPFPCADPPMPHGGASEGVEIPSFGCPGPSRGYRRGSGGCPRPLLGCRRPSGGYQRTSGGYQRPFGGSPIPFSAGVPGAGARAGATCAAVPAPRGPRGGLRCYGAMGLRRRPRAGRAGGGGTSRWRHRRRRRGRRARGRSRRCRARCTNPWRTPAGRRPGAAR